jgi:Fic family protein
MTTLKPLSDIDPRLLETTAILRKTATAGRRLAELKGMSSEIPNQKLLVNTLVLQEAKDSSEIENIITTHDELFRESLFPDWGDNPAAKEVRRYAQALEAGNELVRTSGLLTSSYILRIQETLEENSAGYRKLHGTALKNSFGETVYTPPQDYDTIVRLMSDLERFINDDPLFDADPLIKWQSSIINSRASIRFTMETDGQVVS